MEKRKYISGLAAALLFTFGSTMTAKAVNYNYVTITVDAVDDSGSLQYAIDSDAPEAFSDSSSFQVVPGSTHTIYVRDAAGNVASQVYTIPEQEEKTDGQEPGRQDGPIRADTAVSESYDPETDQRKVNIDVNLANGAFTSPGSGPAAEDGGGTLFDKEKTDGTDDSGKIFYTVTTKEGEVFYMVVDQNRSDNNVYLLTQATVNDLQYLADQNDYSFTVAATGQNSQSLLNMLGSGGGQGQSEEMQPPGNETPEATSGTNSTFLVLVVAAVGGGGCYFYKTRKNRREKQMDEIDAANDLQDYEIEEDDEADEDGDVLEFGEAPEEQDTSLEDEELNGLIALDVESAFGEDGEDKAAYKETTPTEKEAPETNGLGLGDYDEFGEEEE